MVSTQYQLFCAFELKPYMLSLHIRFRCYSQFMGIMYTNSSSVGIFLYSKVSRIGHGFAHALKSYLHASVPASSR